MLEKYFGSFRKNTIGYRHFFTSPYGKKRLIYADWTASGRLYGPIEERITETFGPFVANTHSELNTTGATTTESYHHALQTIKRHVNADENDVIVTSGFGTTSVVNKLQRILALKIHGKLEKYCYFPNQMKPVIFVTHMEHHSNHTSWLETIADVEIVPPTKGGLVNLDQLVLLLEKYKSRKVKIGSFTACSNVTGIQTPYHKMAKIMHEYGGICFVDFAACAPYVTINMHPHAAEEKLDGIFFSPHKFLGGPGTSGVMIFDAQLYENEIPDHPGGGTVEWTNPWGEHKFISDIEVREDGGTPGFLQAIRTALCLNLKEKMGVERILEREKELMTSLFKGLKSIPKVKILSGDIEERLGIISFFIEGIHYNLVVKILNDRFGIQVRGGCACAGTYGHYLLNINRKASKKITDQIDVGDLSLKPGWVRLSIHPIMTNKEIEYIIYAIKETVLHINEWEKDYRYFSDTNVFRNIRDKHMEIQSWFKV